MFDKLTDAVVAWVLADRAAKIAGLVVTIGAGAYVIVATVWMIHQLRMIGGL